MKRFSFFLSAILIFAFLSTTLMAQNDFEPKVKVNGTVQAWASMAQTNTDTNQIGFGLRRVRARLKASLSKNIKAFVQAELTSPKLLDARIEYHLSKNAQIRVGRFIGAGVRAAGLTSHTKIDIVERPVSAQKWGKATIGADYRDYGLAFMGKVNGFGFNLTLHNGSGAANIKPSHKSTASLQLQGIAISGMVNYKPKQLKGLEVGGYYGMGNTYVNDYASFNGYVYYEPKPLRVKLEYIGWTDKNGPTDVTAAGYYAFLGYRITKCMEVIARYEQFDSNTDVDDNEETFITFGLTHSFFPDHWNNAKITAAYVIHNEAWDNSPDNNVFYIMAQFVF